MASETEPTKSISPVVKDGHLPISEFLGELQGPASPFGDQTFPLPVDKIDYRHPGAEDAHTH